MTADARDLDSGDPAPEAPRTIFDLSGTIQQLPFRLQARGEFEYVGTKPQVPAVYQTPINSASSPKRVSGSRDPAFMEGRWTAGVNLLIASGYTGQTLESFSPSDFSHIAASGSHPAAA